MTRPSDYRLEPRAKRAERVERELTDFIAQLPRNQHYKLTRENPEEHIDGRWYTVELIGPPAIGEDGRFIGWVALREYV